MINHPIRRTTGRALARIWFCLLLLGLSTPIFASVSSPLLPSDPIEISAAISHICLLPDGSIDLTIDGGTPPFTITWSTGDTTASIGGLTAGVYNLTLSDALETIDTFFVVTDYCETDVDCSSSFSTYFDGSGSKIMAEGLMAITCGTTTTMPDSLRYTMAVVDVRHDSYDTALIAPMAYHHPDWISSRIGNVDGIEIDGFGNIYVTASSYMTSFFPYDWRYGDIGGGADDLGAAGTVYKIDATTGAPSVFAQLPQQLTNLSGYATFISAAESFMIPRFSGPGLGNITHQAKTGSFYVSNLEDGKIYRLGSDGSILQTFDPRLPDNGLAGFPPEDEIVYGLDVFNGRLYYVMRSPHPQAVNVRSVAIDSTGAILPITDQVEIHEIWTDADVFLYELEPYDIAIAADGKMAIGTRSFANSLIEVYTHSSYNAVYTLIGGIWTRVDAYGPGATTGGSVAGPGESYGGVAWGPYQLGPDDYEVLWSSSGDLREDEHGIIGMAAAGLPNDFTVGNDSLDYIGFEYMPGAGDLKGIGGDVAIWTEIISACKVTAEDDTYFIPNDEVLNEVVASNDFDISGASLSFFTASCGPYNGSIVFHPDGSFFYTPNPGFLGIDSFCYVACNPLLVCDDAKVTIHVTGPAPTAADDSLVTLEDLFAVVEVLGNDSAVTGLDTTAIYLIDLPATSLATVVNNFDGTVVVSPAPDFNGSFSLGYVITDLSGGMDTGAILVEVLPVPDPPHAMDDTYSSADSLPLLLDPLSNDIDVDGDLDSNSLVLISGIPPSEGALAVVGSDLYFNPASGYCGPVTPIRYQIADMTGEVDTGVIYITLACYNLPPTAYIDSSVVCFSDATTINVLDNDFDIDGVLDLTTLSVSIAPSFGTTIVNTDGTIKYQHAGYTGSLDSFTYRVYDNAGSLAEATVLIEIGSQLLANYHVEEPTCGAANGQIEIEIYAGAAPFSYLWNTGDTTDYLSGVPQGFYNLALIDSEGCPHNLNVNLVDGNPLEIESVTPIDASTCNSFDGGLAVQIVPGTGISPPFHLKVNGIYELGPFFGDSIVVIGAPGGINVLAVELTDAVGCVDLETGSFPIGRPPSPVIESIDFNGADCGDPEAKVLINLDDVEIGTPPYYMANYPGPIVIGPIPGGSDTLTFISAYGSYNRFKLFDSNGCIDSYEVPFELAPCLFCDYPAYRNSFPLSGLVASLEWSSQAEAQAYEVRIRLMGGGVWYNLPVITDTTRLIGQLTPLTTYEWQVRSLCDSVTFSDWSPSTAFTTLALRDAGFNVELFPNPARTQATVLLTGFSGEIDLWLLNALCQPILYRRSAQSEIPLSLEGLPAGIYELVGAAVPGDETNFNFRRKLVVVE